MVGKDGSSVVSDRLDIVRLIDARVTSTRRTVTRSKQLAEAAKGNLHIHEDWLRQHNERFGHDLKRQQRRMKRRERIENNKRFAKSALLFLPRLCARLYRGVVSALRAADDMVPARLDKGVRRCADGVPLLPGSQRRIVPQRASACVFHEILRD